VRMDVAASSYPAAMPQALSCLSYEGISVK
jgi:hypothetical protein